MDKKIVLHIGLPKTATTFLQEMVFSKLNDVFFVGYPEVKKIENTPLFYINELNKHTYNKPELPENELNKLKSDISEYINNLAEKNILISNETLCGQIISFQNSYKNARFLKEIFNSAKIVFTFRNQADWAESVYNQLMTKHNRYTINEEFLGYRHGNSIHKMFRYNNGTFEENSQIYSFNWFLITKNYMEIYGKENVLVLPYELLKNDLNDFLNKFYDFTELETYYPEENKNLNPRTTDKIIKYSPILSRYSSYTQNLKNSWVKKFILKNDKGFKKFLLKHNLKELNISKEVFSDYQKEMIKNYYAESNKKLAEIIEVDLGQYNYY